jgi:hypothetical protein
MRLTRLLPAVPALLLALAPTIRADDTKEFLDPANWEGRTDIWKNEGGSIVGETMEDPKYNTFLCSKKMYGDFELSFKVQLRDGVGNSGVQVRSTLADPKKFVVRGPQVDVGKGYWGSLYGEGVGGMMRASDPKKIEKAVKPAEFNDYHITVKGSHVTVKVNGETMVDEDFPTLPGKDKKPFPTEGIIALQIHGGYPKMRVEYRDIKFVDLGKKK